METTLQTDAPFAFEGWTDSLPLQNSSENVTTAQELSHDINEIKEPWAIALLCISYGLISISSLIGNGLIIMSIIRFKKMQTVTNVFIFNLAVADITICIIAIPFQLQTAVLQRIVLPHFMCKLSPFCRELSVIVSVFTLTVIAIDRYCALVYPLRHLLWTFRRSLLIIFTIWILAIALSIPAFLIYRIEQWNHSELGVVFTCEMDGWTMQQVNNHTLVSIVIQYVIPVGIIIVTYILICRKMWGKTPGITINTVDSTIVQRKKNLIKMLILMASLFIFAWLPLHTFNILSIESTAFGTLDEALPYFWFSANWLAMSNSCHNPFICIFFNNKFKRSARELLSFLPCVSGPAQNMSSYSTVASRNKILARRNRGLVASEYNSTSPAPSSSRLTRSSMDPQTLTTPTVSRSGLSSGGMLTPQSCNASRFIWKSKPGSKESKRQNGVAVVGLSPRKQRLRVVHSAPSDEQSSGNQPPKNRDPLSPIASGNEADVSTPGSPTPTSKNDGIFTFGRTRSLRYRFSFTSSAHPLVGGVRRRLSTAAAATDFQLAPSDSDTSTGRHGDDEDSALVEENHNYETPTMSHQGSVRSQGSVVATGDAIHQSHRNRYARDSSCDLPMANCAIECTETFNDLERNETMTPLMEEPLTPKRATIDDTELESSFYNSSGSASPVLSPSPHLLPNRVEPQVIDSQAKTPTNHPVSEKYGK